MYGWAAVVPTSGWTASDRWFRWFRRTDDRWRGVHHRRWWCMVTITMVTVACNQLFVSPIGWGILLGLRLYRRVQTGSLSFSPRNLKLFYSQKLTLIACSLMCRFAPKEYPRMSLNFRQGIIANQKEKYLVLVTITTIHFMPRTSF